MARAGGGRVDMRGAVAAAAVWFALAASAARDRLRERMKALRNDRRYRAKAIRTWDAGRLPEDLE